MQLASRIGVLLAIAAIPVVNLAYAAGEQTWTRPIGLGTAAVFTLLLAAPSLLLMTLLARTRLPAATAFSIAGWLGLVFTNWHLVRALAEVAGLSPIVWRPWQGGLGATLLIGVAVWAGARPDSKGRVISVFAVAVLAVRLIQLMFALPQLVEPPLSTVEATVTIAPETPSTWVIVIDGHPSPRTIRELYAIDLASDLDRLGDLGFRVWDDARSNYTHTTASIPALLSGATFEGSLDGQMGNLLAGLRGQTPLTMAFVEAGYALRVTPAPWSRSACADVAEECFNVARWDERLYFLLRTTPLTDLMPATFGHPMPLRGRDVLGTVSQFSPSGRHFTFVHSTITHRPFILNKDCEVDLGNSAPIAGQLRCAQRLLLEAVQNIDLGRDIVVIASDHGYNLTGDTSAGPSEWTPSMARERFSTFLAISDPADCAANLPGDISNAQVLPLILNCYGNEFEVPDPIFVGMEQGHWGSIVEYQYPWDGWSGAFDE